MQMSGWLDKCSPTCGARAGEAAGEPQRGHQDGGGEHRQGQAALHPGDLPPEGVPGPQHRAILGRADPAGLHAAGDGVLPWRGPVPRHAEGLH